MNDTKPHSAQSHIRLDHDDPRDVHVVAPREDRFFIPAAQAAAACQFSTELDAALRESKEHAQEMNQAILSWCKDHTQVLKAIASVRSPLGGSILVLIIEGQSHDFALDDAVSDFDSLLYKRFPQFRVSVITVPESSANDLSVYVAQDSETVIYARSESTQS